MGLFINTESVAKRLSQVAKDKTIAETNAVANLPTGLQ